MFEPFYIIFDTRVAIFYTFRVVFDIVHFHIKGKHEKPQSNSKDRSNDWRKLEKNERAYCHIGIKIVLPRYHCQIKLVKHVQNNSNYLREKT